MSTYGPAYEASRDQARLESQRERILAYMLHHEWVTLAKIRHDLEYVYQTNVPEPSISAQLRHLRKPAFGHFQLEKRVAVNKKGLWEYRLRPPLQRVIFATQEGLFESTGGTPRPIAQKGNHQ